MRTYRVVFRTATGAGEDNKHSIDVRADSEADAILTAKQQVRTAWKERHPNATKISEQSFSAARAVPITKD